MATGISLRRAGARMGKYLAANLLIAFGFIIVTAAVSPALAGWLA